MPTWLDHGFHSRYGFMGGGSPRDLNFPQDLREENTPGPAPSLRGSEDAGDSGVPRWRQEPLGFFECLL